MKIVDISHDEKEIILVKPEKLFITALGSIYGFRISIDEFDDLQLEKVITIKIKE
jgi:hypothetical protein